MQLPKLNQILETERCILKIPQESDAEEMWNLISENIEKYMIWKRGDSYISSLENIRKARKKGKDKLNWDSGVYNKKTGKIIGRCGYTLYNPDIPSLDIGYWISENYWGKGYIPECVRYLVRFAFVELEGIEKIIIRCDSRNENSAKVALKCGFNFEGEFKKHERIKGELRDTKYFGITREEYFSQK